MTRGERAIFAALVEGAVRPGGELPPVAQTDAVPAFGALLAALPRTNRAALRALLRGLDAAPRAGGPRRRLRDLAPAERSGWLEDAAKRPGARGAAAGVMIRLAAYCYYGDAGVMRLLGYDAEARVREARGA
jgi:hypothetical protein